MGTRRTQHPRRPKRRSFGDYVVTGDHDNPRMTLTTALRTKAFPIELGTRLEVVFVAPDDDEEYGHLELHPVVDDE